MTLLLLGMSGLPSAHTFTTDKWIALNSVMKQYYYYYYYIIIIIITIMVSNIMPNLSTMFVDSSSLFIAAVYFSH
jgi:hypothetical protein